MVGSVNYNSMKLKKQNLKIVRGLENGTVVECLLRFQQRRAVKPLPRMPQ